MRIAYIAPYHGPGLIKERPVIQNRSLAMTTKLELIATMLRANGHDVEVLSQGEVVETTGRFYRAMTEPEPFHPEIPVHYASAWPIRRVNGFWSSLRTWQLFKARHRAKPFDLVLVWNLKLPQLKCALQAINSFKLPVILEYEDDLFVTLSGGERKHAPGYLRRVNDLLSKISGAMACSPRLLSQLPNGMQKLLLRGVIGADLEAAEKTSVKKNWVLFSGSHHRQYGIHNLIAAWQQLDLAGWELHITGDGPETPALRKQSEVCASVNFHGFVSRQELARLMSSARICINPHEVSQTPGNVFAFKIVEYLAAGAHVVTTPMGPIEPELEAGITYMPDNSKAAIVTTLGTLTKDGGVGLRTAAQRVQQTYGPASVAKSLESLFKQAAEKSAKRSSTQDEPLNPVSSQMASARSSGHTRSLLKS